MNHDEDGLEMEDFCQEVWPRCQPRIVSWHTRRPREKARDDNRAHTISTITPVSVRSQ
jgi:hypothetical protein